MFQIKGFGRCLGPFLLITKKMYIVNAKIDLRGKGIYLKKNQKLSDDKAELYLSANPKLNITKLKDGKAKSKDTTAE
ncbi:hypothetical protein KAR91_13565 [Candidatus Pacearchaeota archaeon]|nr:hypothetical protein [Candidatus Pacearchaeota archaeon]